MTLGRILRRLTPKSIGARLALGSAVLVIAALIAAGVSTGFVLSRFIRGQIDQRLDTQIGAVATALSAQPALPATLTLSDPPPFDRMLNGWYWTAEIDGRTYRSVSLASGDISSRTSEDWWGDWKRRPHRGEDGPGPANGIGPRGERLYLREQLVPVGGSWATITASAPAHALVRPLRDALLPVIVSMLALGLLLGIASVVQLRLGLRPLGRLKKGLEDVRTGRAERIGGDQPTELQPLVGELNSLIAQNAEGLKRARGHVSNLGHALNTPLAALSLSLNAGSTKRDAERLRLVEEMQERIRHHLGRARAAALHAPAHLRTPVASRAGDILDVLAKIHAERRLDVKADLSASLAVACEPQDLDEMLGNVLDNAFKWARGIVAIQGRADAPSVVLVIEDDGPGVGTEKIDEILKAGRKLDESVPGHGFGLAITRELAELYGGNLGLGLSPLGGLKVTLTLPAAR